MSLAMTAGFLDAYGIITYDTYVSFMSGNTTQAGFRIGQGNSGKQCDFSAGNRILRGRVLRRGLARVFGVRRKRRLVFGVVAALLALIVGFTQLGFSSGWVPHCAG